MCLSTCRCSDATSTCTSNEPCRMTSEAMFMKTICHFQTLGLGPLNCKTAFKVSYRLCTCRCTQLRVQENDKFSGHDLLLTVQCAILFAKAKKLGTTGRPFFSLVQRELSLYNRTGLTMLTFYCTRTTKDEMAISFHAIGHNLDVFSFLECFLQPELYSSKISSFFY